MSRQRVVVFLEPRTLGALEALAGRCGERPARMAAQLLSAALADPATTGMVLAGGAAHAPHGARTHPQGCVHTPLPGGEPVETGVRRGAAHAPPGVRTHTPSSSLSPPPKGEGGERERAYRDPPAREGGATPRQRAARDAHKLEELLGLLGPHPFLASCYEQATRQGRPLSRGQWETVERIRTETGSAMSSRPAEGPRPWVHEGEGKTAQNGGGAAPKPDPEAEERRRELEAHLADPEAEGCTCFHHVARRVAERAGRGPDPPSGQADPDRVTKQTP